MKTYTFCKPENKEKVKALGKKLKISVDFSNPSTQIRVIASGDMSVISKFDMELYEIENGVKHPSVIEKEKQNKASIQKMHWWEKLLK